MSTNKSSTKKNDCTICTLTQQEMLDTLEKKSLQLVLKTTTWLFILCVERNGDSLMIKKDLQALLPGVLEAVIKIN